MWHEIPDRLRERCYDKEDRIEESSTVRGEPHDIIDKTGCVAVCHAGGSTTSASAGPTPEHVILLPQDLHIRIIGAATGELLRELTLDPARNYQPTSRPPGPTPRTPPPTQRPRTLTWVRGVRHVTRDHNSSRDRTRTYNGVISLTYGSGR